MPAYVETLLKLGQAQIEHRRRRLRGLRFKPISQLVAPKLNESLEQTYFSLGRVGRLIPARESSGATEVSMAKSIRRFVSMPSNFAV